MTGDKIMKRENYKNLMVSNSRENYVSVLALNDRQFKGFRVFARKNDTPSGNDRKKSFFILSGLYGYHLDFVKTSQSGNFVKIKKYFIKQG